MADGAITIYGPDGRALSLSSTKRIDFGPGDPFHPRIDDEGYPPREHQYPVGYNLFLSPRQESGKSLSFALLKALAQACPDILLAVELRTKQLRGLTWDIAVAEDRSPEAREANADDIARVRAFWKRPNKLDDLDFGPWLGQVLHEIYLTDALTLYPQITYGGELHSLVQIDGSTIKPLIDAWGHVVSFQQILYGYPATQYRAKTEIDPALLIYRQYNPRVGSVYGSTPVDDLEAIVQLAIRRLAHQVSWYKDGNVPVGFIEAPAGWTADQIAQFQDYLDKRFSGDTKQRSRMRLLPPGANYEGAPRFEFSKDEQESIQRVVLAYFGVPVSLVVSQVNRATAEETGRRADDVGLEPMKGFLKGLFDDITARYLDAPQLEWVWTFERDPLRKQATNEQIQLVGAGIITRNEARKDRGLDPLDDPMGDVLGMPQTFGGGGVGAEVPSSVVPAVGSEQEVAVAPAAVLNGAQITAATAIVQQVALGQLPRDAGLGQIEVLFNLTRQQAETIMGSAGSTFAPTELEPEEEGEEEPEAEAAKAELARWRRFALKRIGRQDAARFETSAIPEGLAARLKTGLLVARDDASVKALFSGAEELLAKAAPRTRMTKARTARYEKRVEDAYAAYFAKEFKRVAAIGDSLLAGNSDDAAKSVHAKTKP